MDETGVMVKMSKDTTFRWKLFHRKILAWTGRLPRAI